MARIRSVKPDYFRSPSIRKLSLGARYVGLGLITEADDEGRFLASAKALAGALFPHDEDVTAKRFEGWLQEIVSVDTVRLYEWENVRYGYFPEWETHQRISHPTPSRFPHPSGMAPEDIRPEQGTGSKEQGTGKREIAAAFERFWKPYPRKEARAGALVKFTAAVRRGVDPALIVAGSERYAVECVGRERRFVKIPTTWLNNGCWDDDYESNGHDPERERRIAEAKRLAEEGRRAAQQG